jgi:hypothetical protein
MAENVKCKRNENKLALQQPIVLVFWNVGQFLRPLCLARPRGNSQCLSAELQTEHENLLLCLSDGVKHKRAIFFQIRRWLPEEVLPVRARQIG